LIERRSLLQQKLFDRNREPVRLSELFEVSVGRLVKAVRRQGLEGIVAKRADSRYEAGRSGAWIKFKMNKGRELMIGGYNQVVHPSSIYWLVIRKGRSCSLWED
jgi:bifunctional non-homologous end joining protein LigD